MRDVKWGEKVEDADRRDQLKLVYDYIKFHIGLYIGTPAALSVIADALEVKKSGYFIVGLLVAIAIYIVAGIHAGLFMSRQINDPWQENYLSRFEAEAFSPTRRFMHHSLYWFGLAALVIGLLVAVLKTRNFI
jgi:hypothetical protein